MAFYLLSNSVNSDDPRTALECWNIFVITKFWDFNPEIPILNCYFHFSDITIATMKEPFYKVVSAQDIIELGRYGFSEVWNIIVTWSYYSKLLTDPYVLIRHEAAEFYVCIFGLVSMLLWRWILVTIVWTRTMVILP